MSRFGGLSEERPSVFKTRSKLGTHLSTQCSGDERQSRPCEPQTCGVEALYTFTQSYSVKNKIYNAEKSVQSIFEASLVGRKNLCCPVGGLNHMSSVFGI
ncbi:hypothetical protein TNCV_428121 [Trichonephila clavipes]|nr:hypothetical protein TNCV_428121 [Trichonephila clavipes]